MISQDPVSDIHAVQDGSSWHPKFKELGPSGALHLHPLNTHSSLFRVRIVNFGRTHAFCGML